MDIVLAILLILNLIVVTIVVLLFAKMANFMYGDNTASFTSPHTTPGETKTTSTVDEVTPEEFDDKSVPLEQFTPDFNKPLKFVVKEDKDTSTLEEEEDRG